MELKCYRHTDNRHTDRPSDEAVPRGAFAPKKGRKGDKLIKLGGKRGWEGGFLWHHNSRNYIFLLLPFKPSSS